MIRHRILGGRAWLAAALLWPLAAVAQPPAGDYRPVAPQYAPYQSAPPTYTNRYPADRGTPSSDAPPGLTGDQLVLYSNKQIAAGDKIGALHTLERAAAMGNVPALRGLGMAYAYGQGGIPKDVPRGMRYLDQAAATGDAVADFHLGFLNDQGTVIRQDLPKAIALYRKSAAKRFWRAEFALGIDAELGVGMPRSRAEAIRWMKASAADTRMETPALYADYLSRAGARTFKNVEDLSQAFIADYAYRHTDHTVHAIPRGGGLNYGLCSGPYAMAACAHSEFARSY